MKSLCCGYCIMTEKQLLETLGPIFPQGVEALGERIIYMCVCVEILVANTYLCKVVIIWISLHLY